MFDLFRYTGLRRGDAAQLGKQLIREGAIVLDTLSPPHLEPRGKEPRRTRQIKHSETNKGDRESAKSTEGLIDIIHDILDDKVPRGLISTTARLRGYCLHRVRRSWHRQVAQSPWWDDSGVSPWVRTGLREAKPVSGRSLTQISDIENSASRDTPWDSRAFGEWRPTFSPETRLLTANLRKCRHFAESGN
jgi:hypothetical protein